MAGKAHQRKAQATFNRLISVGLRDPFVSAIAGMVVIAVAASYAISALGSATKAIITLALSLAFGVVLVVLRTLLKYVDSTFVKIVCFGASAIIMVIFLTFAVLLIPAATICWPEPYAELLSLPNCGTTIAQKPFAPIALPSITFNSQNAKYVVFVFYRLERQTDAEHIVGALRSAGYKSDGIQSSLNEVLAQDKRPGTTLIKTSGFARPIIDDVSRVVRTAIPVRAIFVSVFPEDVSFQRGHVQISLF